MSRVPRVTFHVIFALVLGAAVAVLTGCPLPFSFSPSGWPGAAASADPSTPSISAAPVAVYSDSNGISGTLSNGQAGSTSADTVIRLESETVGAVIYYTLDSTTPDPRSANTHRYIPSAPLTLAVANPTVTTATASLSVTAAAIGPNMKPSLLTRATVNLQYPQAAAPTFLPDGGAFNVDIDVAFASATPGAVIYYRVSTDPGPVARPVPGQPGTVQYSGPIRLVGPATTYTFAVIAVANQMIDSVTSGVSYSVNYPGCAYPVFNPPSCTLTNEREIRITSDAGSTIFFDFGGRDPVPGTSSRIPSGEFVIIDGGGGSDGILIVRAMAVSADPGVVNSAIAQATYTFQAEMPAPNVPGGTYDTPQSVTLTSGTVDANIFFTTDGTDPLIYGAPYSRPSR